MLPTTILVTGASSGIGLGLALRLHALGHQVILTGRRKALLDATTAGRTGLTGIQADITDPDAINALAAQLAAKHPDLSVVIHSAGIMQAERLGADSTPLSQSEAMIATNLLGPIRLTHALMPQLLAQTAAKIITVSSGLAFVPLAATPTYSATKAAIHSWTQSLRAQLARTAISVHEIAPPAVQTDLMPGQRERADAMPFEVFIDEVMALLSRPRIPDEILVERVGFLRHAEAQGAHDAIFQRLNGRFLGAG